MDVPLSQGFPVAPQSRAGIRSAAVHARKVLGLPHGRLNIPKLLDTLTNYTIYYDVFDRESAPVPIEVEACWVPEDRTIYIRDTVFREMVNGGQRAVFTIGHELGHAILGHSRTYNRLSVANVPIYSNSEYQANLFGAEFTMPLEQIRRFGLQSAEEISRVFGVSIVAARVRISELARKGELQ
ncbi:ImmA/IrrE family metallo-endopeptidase [Variovorax sp. RT4R15]|uniref:ImmA/IrrE family metallo-endopeptidase n=1 Tax=Variovorax sp. RT4R15 TaxID=3443737 RepID=UPI003F48B0CE